MKLVAIRYFSKTSNGKPGFFKHVFNFDEQSKAEMLNIVQYAVLALIPVVILNKLIPDLILLSINIIPVLESIGKLSQ